MAKKRSRPDKSSATSAQQSVAPPPSTMTETRATWLGIAGLAGLVFVMFFDMLLFPGSRVLSNGTTDLFLQFVSWRDFGFRELALGNVALWNPHIYGGAPYFGGMQAALFYPINWLFLILPLTLAINWSIALNVWLLGVFMFLWARFRGLHPFAAFVAGALLMFCGPHFLHIYAGHITNLPAMTWAPLIFLSIDAWFARQRLQWLLLGMMAVAMQILAGHPQYVFYTALAAGFYTLLRLVEKQPNRLKIGFGLLSVHAGGAALAAVQLLTGVQAAGETIRDEKLPYEFASMFGFPPENLLTLVAPGFFGDMTNQPYWGRCYLWEMSLFFGVLGLGLAVYGGVFARPKGRLALLLLIPITLLFALGKNTPLFPLLYEFAPGFDKFRSISKFIFQTSLFLTLFAGIGMDRLLRQRRVETSAIWGVGGGAALLLLFYFVTQSMEWRPFMLSILATKESYLNPQAFQNGQFVQGAHQAASSALLIAAAILGLTTALAWAIRRDPRAVYLVGAVAVLEIFVFAQRTRETFDTQTIVNGHLQKFYKEHPGDHRVINPMNPNSAMSMGVSDVWGFDPGVVRRYAEFIAWTQGTPPEKATQYVNFTQLHPLLSIVRLRYALMQVNNQIQLVEAKTPPLAKIQLVTSHRVLANRDAIFDAMSQPDFDPKREVLLEKEPQPAPVPTEQPGNVRIVREDTDSMDIEAELTTPAVLVVTEAWTPAWQASPLPGSSQTNYEVLPANYAIRGIPLAAGSHKLRLEYRPNAYRNGGWISAFSLIAWLGGWILVIRNNSALGHKEAAATA